MRKNKSKTKKTTSSVVAEDNDSEFSKKRKDRNTEGADISKRVRFSGDNVAKDEIENDNNKKSKRKTRKNKRKN